MWLSTECNLTFDITTPTPFILMLRPRNDFNQWVAEQTYTISPIIAGDVNTFAEVRTENVPTGATNRWHELPKLSLYSITGTLGEMV